MFERYRRQSVRREEVLAEDADSPEFAEAAPDAWEPEVAAMSAQGVAALLQTIDVRGVGAARDLSPIGLTLSLGPDTWRFEPAIGAPPFRLLG